MVKKKEELEEKKLTKEEATAKAKKDMFLDIVPYLIPYIIVIVNSIFNINKLTCNNTMLTNL